MKTIVIWRIKAVQVLRNGSDLQTTAPTALEIRKFVAQPEHLFVANKGQIILGIAANPASVAHTIPWLINRLRRAGNPDCHRNAFSWNQLRIVRYAERSAAWCCIVSFSRTRTLAVRFNLAQAVSDRPGRICLFAAPSPNQPQVSEQALAPTHLPH